MTVKELIAELSKMDLDRLVILQKDSEGNSHSPLAGTDDNTAYTAHSTWGGDVGKQKLSKRDRKMGYAMEDLAGSDAVPCVVLFPIN